MRRRGTASTCLLLLSGGALALAGCAGVGDAGTSFPEPAGDAAAATIDAGPWSGVQVPRQVVVRDDADWRLLWREHGAGGAPPTVDFSREMVVGVFLGTRTTGGHLVEVTRVDRAGDGLSVHYLERLPDPFTSTTRAITSPFHLVRTERVPGDVVFDSAIGASGAPDRSVFSGRLER